MWQPAARGHWACTDPSAARARGPALCAVCSLVNWELTHSLKWSYTPFWTCVEGPPFVDHSKLQEDFRVAPVIGVSGVATTGRIFCIFFVLRDSSWSARCARCKPHGVWHKCRLLNYPWVDTRPAKCLSANTSHIGECLLKPLEIRKPRACAVA